MTAALKQRINDDVKTAMREKDKERLGALRLITAAIKQKEIDERIELDDTQVLAILDKLAKQHRDSIEQYQNAGRDDLVAKENQELAIVQSYLPQQLDEGEIKELISAAINETGAQSMKEMGALMGVLRPQVQGRADMGKVSDMVKEQLNK